MKMTTRDRENVDQDPDGGAAQELQRIDQGLDGIARHADRLPAADFQRLHGGLGLDLDGDGG